MVMPVLAFLRRVIGKARIAVFIALENLAR